jgi:sterol desaturase/sphingolipid hydroxylase (fatty acid hydroxylase superfamily)
LQAPDRPHFRIFYLCNCMARLYTSNKDECVRMFRSPVLEALTRVHFTVPLVLFLPASLFFLYRAFFVHAVPPAAGTGLVLAGLAVWTLTEYLLHRFVFHLELPGRIGRRIHFIFHGVHHEYPNDSLRLVMVPTVSIPLAALFYGLFHFLLGAAPAAPFFAGFVFGYLFYDMSHYALHHYNFRSRFWLALKNHHMIHHYGDNRNGFGVSSKFWDLVFRTTFGGKGKATLNKGN